MRVKWGLGCKMLGLMPAKQEMLVVVATIL